MGTMLDAKKNSVDDFTVKDSAGKILKEPHVPMLIEELNVSTSTRFYALRLRAACVCVREASREFIFKLCMHGWLRVDISRHGPFFDLCFAALASFPSHTLFSGSLDPP